MRRVTLVIAWALSVAAAPPLQFTPIRADFAPSAAIYRERWDEEGARIAAVLERIAGVSFPDQPIEVLIRDGAPMTSLDGRTIRLRAGYPINVWRATMTHELGHRLAIGLGRATGIDDHRALYLFYYDAMIELYGQTFADRVVSMERRIPGLYDYDAAWTWALAMTREQRQAMLATLRPPRLGYHAVGGR
jgi:hypothetical protein